MTQLEKEAIETFHQMWNTWHQPTDESIAESFSTWDINCNGFGTALTEVWRCRDDFKNYCKQMFIQNSDGFKVDYNWLETDQLSDDVVTLWGEIRVTIETSLKKIVFNPIRVSAVFKNIDNQMKVIHSHSSSPDITSEEDFWPGIGEPKYYDEVSVLFTDFVGFTNAVSTLSPLQLISELNELFAEFDVITTKFNLEKIKTIGDAYMAAGGLTDQKDFAVATIQTAKEMLEYLENRNENHSIKWDMRVGIHCGPVVGGVIGTEKLSFDLWGDTVNLASRIENSGAPNKINISARTYELVQKIIPCEYRGKIETKDGNNIDMHFVV